MLDSLLEECPEEMPTRADILDNMARHNPRLTRHDLPISSVGRTTSIFGYDVEKQLSKQVDREDKMDITCTGCKKECKMSINTRWGQEKAERQAVKNFMKRSYSCPSAVC